MSLTRDSAGPRSLLFALVATTVPGAVVRTAPATPAGIVLHVDGARARNGNGTQTAPFNTILAAIGNAPKGQPTRIVVAPGVYRERDVIAIEHRTAGLTLEAAPGAGEVSVRGSELYTGWTRDGEIWSHPWRFTWGLGEDPWAGNTPWSNLNELTRRREIVFVDYAPDRPASLMRQVLTIAECRQHDGTYCVDEAAGRLYLNPPGALDPNTVPVEVGEREALLRIASPDVTVRGIAFEHAASPTRGRAVSIHETSRVTLENVRADWNNWGGIQIFMSSHVTLRNVGASWNGWKGIGGSGKDGTFHHLTLEGVTASYNNTWRGAGKRLGWPGGAWRDGSSKSWDAAGIKLLSLDHGVFKGPMHTIGNDAPGLWFDWSNRHIAIDGLTTEENLGAGLFLESSPGPFQISRLLAYGNGFGAGDGAGGEGGLALNNSRDVTCTASVIVDNNKQIFSANRGASNVRRNGIQSGNWRFDRCVIAATSSGRRLVDAPWGAVAGTPAISGISWGEIIWQQAEGGGAPPVFYDSSTKQGKPFAAFHQRFPGGSHAWPDTVFRDDSFQLAEGNPGRAWALPTRDARGGSAAATAPPAARRH